MIRKQEYKHIKLGFICGFLLLACIAFAVPTGAWANSKYAGLVIDADTGKVYYTDHATERRYPASLTKMMTLYLTFDALNQGKLSMGQRLPVSRHAASQPPSKLGFRPGDRITVRDAILSLVVKSANDAAVVLAEAVGGSEWQFARMMTAKARRLGMNNTQFMNASGLHNSKQYSTAEDMAKLAVALLENHQRYYSLFKRTQFSYNGRSYKGHNRVMRSYRGADGIKTGYTGASGYNLVTSAVRNGTRLIGVVMGGKTSRSRDRHMTDILNRGFSSSLRYARSDRSFRGKAPVPMLKEETFTDWAEEAPVPELKLSENDGVRSEAGEFSMGQLAVVPKPLLVPASYSPSSGSNDQYQSVLVRRKGKYIPLPVYKPEPIIEYPMADDGVKAR